MNLLIWLRQGFPLRINIILLIVAVALTILCGHLDGSVINNTCLILASILICIAIGPSLFREAVEQSRAAKPIKLDSSNDIWKEIDTIRRQMCVKWTIAVKVRYNWPNVESKFRSITIGQTILDTLNEGDRRSLFAHELAHIQKCHSFLKLSIFVPIAIVLCLVAYRLFLMQFNPFAIILLIVAIFSILSRFITWPFEYQADFVASEFTGENVFTKTLLSYARSKNINIKRDFYFHPSVSKRINNLNLSKTARIVKWYLEV
jgi:Zn-dependent protease with chaperone function